MKSHLIIICLLTLSLYNCKSDKNESKTIAQKMSETEQESIPNLKSDIKITPINHATFILQCDNTVIYVDPVGGSDSFKDQPKPKPVRGLLWFVPDYSQLMSG